MAPTRKDFFLSQQQLPLTEVKTQNNFELELADLSFTELPAAPKPDFLLNGMMTQKDNSFYCNIFLNY